MRQQHYTITSRDIHHHAAALCQKYLRFEDHGPICTALNLLTVLFYAAVLRNVWVWLHWEVLSHPCQGGWKIELHQLVFRQMLLGLQHLAEALFGVCDEIRSKRPLPT